MRSNKIFVVWSVIVLFLVSTLTTLGYVINKDNAEYEKIEKTLTEQAKKYVEVNFLYPNEGETAKVTTNQLLDDYLKTEDLTLEDDTCQGYVEVTFHNVYEYKAYIKCQNYTTHNYQE